MRSSTKQETYGHGRRSGLGAGSRRGALPVAAVLALAASAIGCAHGDFFWVEDARAPTPSDHDYRVSAGDVIAVHVWQQDAMSADRSRVREDGKISLPFLQDVEVAGMTPSEISTRLQAKLKSFIVNPVVTISLVEQPPVRVSVVGEVARPGTYELERGPHVLQALAAAGGLSEWAHRDRIFVLRYGYWADGNPAPARIRFRWEALARGTGRAATFALRAGDVVVVE